MATPVPSSEAEVFEQYYAHVKFLVSRAGIRRDYVEDYAMALMVKFVERGMLGKYDPEYLSEVDGIQRTSTFKTFLSGFVNSYLLGFAKRDSINASRSLYSSDMRLGDNYDIPLLDYLGITVSDDTEEVEAADLVRAVRASLEKSGKKNLLLFFEMVLLQLEEYGKVEVKELAEMFEVTRTTIHNWLKKLRAEFEKCQ